MMYDIPSIRAKISRTVWIPIATYRRFAKKPNVCENIYLARILVWQRGKLVEIKPIRQGWGLHGCPMETSN